MSCRMLLIMSVISFGVIVASYGEVSVSWVGVVYQMGGVVGEALRLIFMEIFVKRKGVRLNSLSVMYYVSPCRCTNAINTYLYIVCFTQLLVGLFNVSLLQCTVSVYSMDLPREVKNGFCWHLEFPSSYLGTQLSLHFCSQSVCFSCHLKYKRTHYSSCWSCQGLGSSSPVCFTVCWYKAYGYKPCWLWHW